MGREKEICYVFGSGSIQKDGKLMDKVKEKIIKNTTALIEENGGDLKPVTARVIAGRCGVALGLINYHFGSKDKLIEICVQRIVNRILLCFYSSENIRADSDEERLINQASGVLDFFFENKAIARIFILSDFKDYTAKSCSAASRTAFAAAVKKTGDKRKRRILAFILTSALQAAFLTGESSADIIGYDLNDKLQRDLFVAETVHMLFYGCAYE